MNILQIEKEEIEYCPICLSRSRTIELKDGYDFETNTGKYYVYKCKKCCVMYTNPQPTDKSISLLYEKRETSDFVKKEVVVNFLRSISVRFELARIKKMLRIENKKTLVLDYGCGDGQFISITKKIFSDTKCFCADFHIKQPENLNNSIKYYEYANLPRGNLYDIIFCRHVLEHHKRPTQLVDTVMSLLKNDGVAVFIVPTLDTVWYNIFKKYYFPLYLPRHLVHFSKKSIARIFSSYTIVKTSSANTPVLGRSLGYMFNVDIRNTSLLGLLTYPIQLSVDFLLRRSTLLQIVVKNNE